MSKKLCVFDLDGTLVNSISDIAASMNRALAVFGCPIHTEEEYCRMVGHGMNLLVQRALPDEKKDRWEELAEEYHKHYIAHCCDLSKPYPGILDLVAKLKMQGIGAAVLSNKPHLQTLKMVETLFPRGIFDAVLGQKEEFPRKPDPSSLFYLMTELEIDRKNVLYIGDSAVDITLGKNAGVPAIGVAWGLRGTEELKEANAQWIADNPRELFELIMKQYKG